MGGWDREHLACIVSVVEAGLFLTSEEYPYTGRDFRCWETNTNDKRPICYLIGMLVRIKFYITWKSAL